MKKFIMILLFLCAGAIKTYAQALSYSVRQELLKNQLSNFSETNNPTFNPENDFIRGKLFFPPANSIRHPFFINNDWKSGKIWSSGKEFDIENIKYDISMDYLVHMHKSGSTAYPIYMTREYIQEFIISDHHFKYLQNFDEHSETGNLYNKALQEKKLKNKFKPGYYEILYDKNTKFYLRWEKSKDIRYSLSGSNYVQEIYYLLEKDGKFIEIRNKKSLIDALEDRDKEIKTFIKANNIRFQKNNYESFIKILTYYDNL